MAASIAQALPQLNWRGLLCRLGLLAHRFEEHQAFFPGRRRQSAQRPADPPGWGYVLTWLECSACLRQRRLGAHECWAWDHRGDRRAGRG